MANKNLQTNCTSISKSIIQITTTYDLLKAKCINEQLLQFGRNDVQIEIAAALNKCCKALDINMDNFVMQILVQDIIDKYKWDSIEDVQQCLKKGRQGNYGTTFNKLNMIVISEWMQKHLSEKAQARKAMLSKQKAQHSEQQQHNTRTPAAQQAIDKLLQMTAPQAREYTPSAASLKHYASMLKLFTSQELQQAQQDWKKRARKQYLQLVENEIASRKKAND